MRFLCQRMLRIVPSNACTGGVELARSSFPSDTVESGPPAPSQSENSLARVSIPFRAIPPFYPPARKLAGSDSPKQGRMNAVCKKGKIWEVVIAFVSAIIQSSWYTFDIPLMLPEPSLASLQNAFPCCHNGPSASLPISEF